MMKYTIGNTPEQLGRSNMSEQLFHIPVQEMSTQQLNMLLALNEDAVFDLQTELNLLRERDRVLREEIQRRGMVRGEGL